MHRKMRDERASRPTLELVANPVGASVTPHVTRERPQHQGYLWRGLWARGCHSPLCTSPRVPLGSPSHGKTLRARLGRQSGARVERRDGRNGERKVEGKGGKMYKLGDSSAPPPASRRSRQRLAVPSFEACLLSLRSSGASSSTDIRTSSRVLTRPE